MNEVSKSKVLSEVIFEMDKLTNAERPDLGLEYASLVLLLISTFSGFLTPGQFFIYKFGYNPVRHTVGTIFDYTKQGEHNDSMEFYSEN